MKTYIGIDPETTKSFSYNVTLPVFCPSKKNSKQILRDGNDRPFIAASTAYKKWQSEIVLVLKSYMSEKHLWFTKCNVVLTLSDKSNRIYDLTNKAESIMDALVDAEVIRDDNRFVVQRLELRQIVSEYDFWQIEISGFVNEKDKAELEKRMQKKFRKRSNTRARK